MLVSKKSEERGKKMSDVLVIEVHTSASGKLQKKQTVNLKVIEFSGDTHDVVFPKSTSFGDGSVTRHIHELGSDVAHADMAAIEISFPDATPGKKKVRRWHVDYVDVQAVSRTTGYRRHWRFPVYAWLELNHCVFFEATPRLPCDTPGKISELRRAEIDRHLHLYQYDAYHSKLPAAAVADESTPSSSTRSGSGGSSSSGGGGGPASTAPPLPGPMEYQARSLPAHFGGSYEDLPSDEQWTNPSMRIMDWHAAKKQQMHELGVPLSDKEYKRWRDDKSAWSSFAELNDFFRAVPHTHQQTFWKSDVELGRQLLEGVHPTRIERVTEQYLIDHPYVQLSAVPERLLEGMKTWQAMVDGRIFIVNYTILACDKFQVPIEDSQRNFMASPLCMLFARPSDDELVPVAIQLKKHGVVFAPPAHNMVPVTAAEKEEERLREQQSAERQEAVSKAQQKLIEVGREVEDAAEESEREINEIKRRAYDDIEEKRAKFHAIEQQKLAKVQAMSENANAEEKAAMDEAVASLSAPVTPRHRTGTSTGTGTGTAATATHQPSVNRLGPQQPYKEADKVTHTDWLLAKAFFLNADAIFHQVISTYLLTHASLEPYVLGLRRNVSSMHPVHKLLAPHFRGVLATNSVARSSLVGPDGVLSALLPPGTRMLELARFYYANNGYQLHQQSFPAQLAKRGVAAGESKLKNYRWRDDGQLLWDAISDYVNDFLDLFYKDSASVQEDPELRAWYREVVEIGHEGCPFKPLLCQSNLKTTISTLIFNASCQHSSLTAGGFAYNSYAIARPFIMHGDPEKLIDSEKSSTGAPVGVGGGGGEIESAKFFRYMPCKVDTARQLALATLEVNTPFRHDFLRQESWREMWLLDEDSRYVFARFQHRLKEIEKYIDKQNHERTLNHAVRTTFSPADRTVTRVESRSVANDTTTTVTTSKLIHDFKGKRIGAVIPRLPYVFLAPSSISASLTA